MNEPKVGHAFRKKKEEGTWKGGNEVGALEDQIETTSDGTEFEDISIEKPFNPSLINITTKQMSLDTLIKRMKEKEVDLSPDFQRSEVWSPTAKSRLIESILIRIPLPAFYMDATAEDDWLVVDGLQRLLALRDFVVEKRMSLKGLEFLTNFNNNKYNDLPRNYQRRIEETQVTVYLIEQGTPAEVKFNIFKRINTGGMPLSAQEIRHALHQGPVTKHLKELANNTSFKKATNNSISDKRMAARECVLRFHAFLITPPNLYKATDFDTFLSEAMETLNKKNENEMALYKERFIRTLKASYKIFGKRAFRRHSLRGMGPINKALFEVWTVSMDSLSDQRIEYLFNNKAKVNKIIEDFLIKDVKFNDAVSQATGDIAKVRFRFKRFKEILEEC